MRDGIHQNVGRGPEEEEASGERGYKIESLERFTHPENIMLAQDARNVAIQVRMQRMQWRQEIRRLCQDARLTNHMQDRFFLMYHNWVSHYIWTT